MNVPMIVPGTSSPAEITSVRAFEHRDVAQVCELFAATFRRGKGYSGGDLAKAIETTYLGSPAYAPEIGSIVHLDGCDRIDGFMGVIALNLQIGERRLRAGVLSAYMADGSTTHPAIGVSLVRHIVSRPFDLLFTDTANRMSLDIARAMRFTALPLHSLEWLKVLRPFGTGSDVLLRKAPWLKRLIDPFAGTIDGRLSGLAATQVDPSGLVGTSDRPIDDAAFVARAPAFLAPYALRPTWDEADLSWLLAQARTRTKNGPLHIREVVDRAGRCIGLYLLYAKPNRVAFALQILAQAGREPMVVANVIEQARALKAVAVRGAASPEVVQGLLRQRGIVYRNVMNAIARTSDPDIALALRTGSFSLGGLTGETWTRIVADDFG